MNRSTLIILALLVAACCSARIPKSRKRDDSSSREYSEEYDAEDGDYHGSDYSREDDASYNISYHKPPQMTTRLYQPVHEVYEFEQPYHYHESYAHFEPYVDE